MNELDVPCPGCSSPAGDGCRRKAYGRVYTTPCTIRVVVADRARAERMPTREVKGALPTDLMIALLRAASKNGALRALYNQLIEEGR
jgi:hypothetical protein